MTIEQIIASDKPMLTPTEIAEVVGADPQDIRNQAHNNPAMLGFPVCVIGTRTKIPRVGFLKFLGVKDI